MMCRAYFAMLVLLLHVMPVYAYKTEDLVEVDRNEFAKVSVFKEGVAYLAAGARTVWVFFDYSAKGSALVTKESGQKETIKVAAAQWQYSCTDSKMQVLDAYFINETGDETKLKKTLDTVAPSAVANVRSYVCK